MTPGDPLQLSASPAGRVFPAPGLLPGLARSRDQIRQKARNAKDRKHPGAPARESRRAVLTLSDQSSDSAESSGSPGFESPRLNPLLAKVSAPMLQPPGGGVTSWGNMLEPRGGGEKANNPLASACPPPSPANCLAPTGAGRRSERPSPRRARRAGGGWSRPPLLSSCPCGSRCCCC